MMKFNQILLAIATTAIAIDIAIFVAFVACMAVTPMGFLEAVHRIATMILTGS